MFKSNFFGSFTAGIFVLPNRIDFEYVLPNFLELVNENWQVLAVVCGLFVLFVPLAAISSRLDKRDIISVSKLIPNLQLLELEGNVQCLVTEFTTYMALFAY